MTTSRRIRGLLRRLVPVLLLAGLAACGGGSRAPAPAPVLDLGLVASTIATRQEVLVQNPLGTPAEVRAVGGAGPFAPDPADLPATLGTGAALPLDLLFGPLGAGPVTGTITLRFVGDAETRDVTYEVRARGEPVTWEVLTPTLDFGLLAPGETAEREARVRNASALSPVTLTSANLPAGGFSLVDSPLPRLVAPGATAALRLRYAPLGSGTHDGLLRIGPLDPGGPLDVQVRAEARSDDEELVVDFGSVPLDASGLTPVLQVQVPSDAISLHLEGLMDPGRVVGLGSLEGPGGRLYENTSSTGAYVWVPGWEVFSTTVPNTDRGAVQLVPGGGTYRFRLWRMQGSGSSMRVRAIVERRAPGASSTGVLPLNVWLARGIAPTAATAEADGRLQAVLARADAVLRGQGISLGDVDYYDLVDPRYDDVTEAEFDDMLALTGAAAEVRLNLFFVRETYGGQIVGVSATIGGPKRNGTGVSGVMSVYEGFSSGLIGLIAAHEMGHYLGLFHTVEADGSHDFIDDTPECPAVGTNAECPVMGGGLLMHWQALGGELLTDGQGLVLRGHPHVAAGGAPASLATKPAVEAVAEWEALLLPPGWCGTCARAHGDLR